MSCTTKQHDEAVPEVRTGALVIRGNVAVEIMLVMCDEEEDRIVVLGIIWEEPIIVVWLEISVVVTLFPFVTDIIVREVELVGFILGGVTTGNVVLAGLLITGVSVETTTLDCVKLLSVVLSCVVVEIISDGTVTGEGVTLEGEIGMLDSVRIGELPMEAVAVGSNTLGVVTVVVIIEMGGVLVSITVCGKLVTMGGVIMTSIEVTVKVEFVTMIWKLLD